MCRVENGQYITLPRTVWLELMIKMSEQAEGLAQGKEIFARLPFLFLMSIFSARFPVGAKVREM